MEAIAIVTGLAVLQAFLLAFNVGKARAKYEVSAPAISGVPEFERTFRVHQNTVEQLVIFLPGLWMFGYYVNAYAGAAVGIVFVIARAIYSSAYIGDPKNRGKGFGLTALSELVLVVGGMLGAAWSLVQG